MEVRRPDTGEQLRRVGANGEAVAAIDATFSAPKSVSAVWALACPSCASRDRAGARDRDRPGARLRGPAGADAPPPGQPGHGGAREGGRAGGDELAAHDRAGGRRAGARPAAALPRAAARRGASRRADGRDRLALVAGAPARGRRRYRTELARELQALGFEVQRGTGRGGRYFELDGVPQPLLDRWSSRHHQVTPAIRERLADQERALEATIAHGGPGGSRRRRPARAAAPDRSALPGAGTHDGHHDPQRESAP